MPPQSNDADDDGCCHEMLETPTKGGVAVYFQEQEGLNFSLTPDGTLVTEIDSSFSKDSITTIDEEEVYHMQQHLRHRSTPSSGSDDLSQDSWLFEQPGMSSRPSMSKLPRNDAPKRRRQHFVGAVAIFLIIVGAATIRSGSYQPPPSWHQFMNVDGPRIRKQIAKEATGDKFTIRLSGTRVDLLQQSLDAYSTCSRVKEIQIGYRGEEQVPDILLSHEMGKAEPIGSPPTPAVLLLSQEVVLTCDELERAFREWKEDPSRTVGFFGYKPAGIGLGPNSVSLEPVSSGSGSYSMVSNNAAIMHRSFLDALPANPDESCCEVFNSLLVSLATSKPAVVVRSNPHQSVRPTLEKYTSLRRGSTLPSCSSKCVPNWILNQETFSVADEASSFLGTGRRRLTETN